MNELYEEKCISSRSPFSDKVKDEVFYIRIEILRLGIVRGILYWTNSIELDI